MEGLPKVLSENNNMSEPNLDQLYRNKERGADLDIYRSPPK